MLNEENKKLCEKLVDQYGKPLQLTILLEELAELQGACATLQQRIAKILRYGNEWFYVDENFFEELADVHVMCQQAQIMFNISDDEINKRASEKLERALKNERS